MPHTPPRKQFKHSQTDIAQHKSVDTPAAQEYGYNRDGRGIFERYRRKHSVFFIGNALKRLYYFVMPFRGNIRAD